MPPIAQPEWIQYGSFGLLAIGIVGGIPAAAWIVVGMFQRMQSAHEVAIDKICCTFKEETKQCRDERLEVQKCAEAERDKDRVVRHELRNTLQQLTSRLTSG